MAFYKVTAAGILLSVRLQPRSSYNKLIGVHGDALKIKISSPPLEGQANLQAQEYLAELFGRAKSSVVLQQGQKSKNKVFLLRNITESAFKEVLQNKKVSF